MLQTHSMSGLNLALQWHLRLLHVQDKSQGGTVFFGGMLLKVLVFMSVKHLELLELSSSFRISQTTLLCFYTLSACKCDRGHDSSTWGHVVQVLVLQSVQFGFGYWFGQNKCFRAFLIYWLNGQEMKT